MIIAVVWPASRLQLYPIVDSTKMEVSIKTYVAVTGSENCGLVSLGLLEMRDVGARSEIIKSRKNMLKNIK